jgi:nucleotidyltransferase substrate binding protein (TIGR01987 family)
VTLELNSLALAVDALKRSLNVANNNMATLSVDLRETVRAGVIQNFEVAYEQCWKFIQRWIRENRTPEDADHPRTRKELFRLAARYGLITDPLPWFEYSDARNLTSHTYDAKQAEVVFAVAGHFSIDAQYLLKQLKERND